MRISKDMKKMLETAYEAPEPSNKEKFLRKLPKAQISHTEFMVLQAAYMKKWVWVVSLLVLGIALKSASFLDRNVLGLFSALMPFIALTVTTENTRSASYGMEELEMASRFSLRSVALARMGILGGVHFVLICCMVPVGLQNQIYGPLQAGVYLTVPYLLTVLPGLMAARRIHGKESGYVCAGIAAIVSVIFITLGSNGVVYHEKYFSWWLASFIILVIMLGAEWRRTIKETEELAWNLQ